MTLKQWLDNHPAAHCREFSRDRGDSWTFTAVTFAALWSNGQHQGISQLWNLSDYVVSSRQGDCVHLLARDEVSS